MKIVLKVLVFSAVCFATWMITSSTVARQLARQKKQQVAVPSQSVATSYAPLMRRKTVTSPTKPGSAHDQVELGGSGAFAEAYLRSRSITVAEGVATVKAHVSLADQREGMSYTWRLRVVDAQEFSLAGQVYEQQMFTVDVGGQKEVDFLDTVEVPPGARRIELVLYAKSAEEDLSFLDDDETARSHQLIRAIKLMTE